MFTATLPQPWLDALTDAIMAEPTGVSRGATVIANKLAAPDAAPGIALVGDAAHAVSWRLGLSLQAALESAAALGSAMGSCDDVAAALQEYQAKRCGATEALANVDRLSPVFLGEYVPLGPLKTVVQVALLVRMALSKLLRSVGVPRLAPHASYIAALKAGVPYEKVWKRVKTETALASGLLIAAIGSFVQFCWYTYSSSRYIWA